MTVVYESKRYPALGFYVDGAFKRFSNGVYTTEDDAEIAVLDAMSDVTRVPEAKSESDTEIPQETSEVKPADEPVKPAPKRKPSVK